jgi:hypothetical protein
VEVFQMWGFTDASSWIPSTYPGWGAALPLDKKYDRKFAYWGLYNALAGQAEKLPVRASSGEAVSGLLDLAMSGGAGRRFPANGAGDFLTLGVPVPFAGSYAVRVGVRRANNTGQFQLSVAPLTNETYVSLGAKQETYSASAGVTSFNLGTNSFAAPGEYLFRFTVPSKNSSSTGYELVLDYIRLTPVDCQPVISAIPSRVVRVNQPLPPIVFTAEDDVAMGSLQVSASSSNQALVPDTNIVLTARAPFYALAVQPLPNTAGTAEITVTAGDGSRTATNRFRLDIYNPVPPVIQDLRIQGGLAQLTVSNAQPGLVYRIETSTNLLLWTPAFTTNTPPPVFRWTDPIPPVPRQYYRVLTEM